MIKNKIIMESKKIREDKAWNYLKKNRDQLFDTIFSHNEVTGIIERNDTIDISINEFGFHKKYLKEINNILEITRFYKLTEDNNIVKKYIKLKSDIEKSHDTKKYLIDLSLKNSKYKFLPHLYSEKLKFLIPIARLDKFYRIIAEQAKYQTTTASKKIIKNKEILKRKKISNWKKLELKSTIKEIQTNYHSKKINIRDPKLYETILIIIYSIISRCINFLLNINLILCCIIYINKKYIYLL
jgi:hypothetical protein